MRVISILPWSGPNLAENTPGTGTEVCLETSFIASASAGRTPLPDLVTKEKSYSSMILRICLLRTVMIPWSAGRVAISTDEGHGNRVFPVLMYRFLSCRFSTHMDTVGRVGHPGREFWDVGDIISIFRRFY